MKPFSFHLFFLFFYNEKKKIQSLLLQKWRKISIFYIDWFFQIFFFKSISDFFFETMKYQNVWCFDEFFEIFDKENEKKNCFFFGKVWDRWSTFDLSVCRFKLKKFHKKKKRSLEKVYPKRKKISIFRRQKISFLVCHVTVCLCYSFNTFIFEFNRKSKQFSKNILEWEGDFNMNHIICIGKNELFFF